MIDYSELDQIALEILEEMSLKEKASIASLEEREILHFHKLFDTLIIEHLGEQDEIGKAVVHRIWEVLRKTHRIRSLKAERTARSGSNTNGTRN